MAWSTSQRMEKERECLYLSGLEGDEAIKLWYALGRLNARGIKEFKKNGEFRREIYKAIEEQQCLD